MGIGHLWAKKKLLSFEEHEKRILQFFNQNLHAYIYTSSVPNMYFFYNMKKILKKILKLSPM